MHKFEADKLFDVHRIGRWQGNQTNIDRTTALVQRLVAMFKDKVDVIPIIGVLNE